MISEIDVIPDGSESDYSESVDLDGTSYDFRFVWNSRMACWTLTVSLDGAPIISARPIVYELDLFERAQGPRPAGALVVLTLAASGAGDTPGISDFGTVARLYYVTKEPDGRI